MTLRKRHIIPFLAVAATILCLFYSCSKENPAYKRENLKGTWLMYAVDGNTLDERDYTVMTFSSSGTVLYEGVLTLDSANYKWGDNTLRYDIYCCDFSISGQYSGLFGFLDEVSVYQKLSFALMEDSLMILNVDSCLIDGVQTQPEYTGMTMRKLPMTYAVADTIYGIWQFNTRNGGDFSNYRVQFQPEGLLVMSVRTGENSWDQMGSEDYYRLYDNFLSMTLYDNDMFGTPGKWDVKNFLIDSVSAASGRMYLRSGGDEYMLSYISSN